MIAIKDKDMEMPNACTSTQEALGDIEVANCPLYNVCKHRDTIRTNYKPADCPLVEIVTCKYCNHSRTCVIEEKTHRFCNCEKHRLQEVADDYFCGDGERRE